MVFSLSKYRNRLLGIQTPFAPEFDTRAPEFDTGAAGIGSAHPKMTFGKFWNEKLPDGRSRADLLESIGETLQDPKEELVAVAPDPLGNPVQAIGARGGGVGGVGPGTKYRSGR